MLFVVFEKYWGTQVCPHTQQHPNSSERFIKWGLNSPINYPPKALGELSEIPFTGYFCSLSYEYKMMIQIAFYKRFWFWNVFSSLISIRIASLKSLCAQLENNMGKALQIFCFILDFWFILTNKELLKKSLKNSSLFIKNQIPVSKYMKRDGSSQKRSLRLWDPAGRMLQMLKICMDWGGNWIHPWKEHTPDVSN